MTPHPSRFALERYASQETGLDEVRHHLEGCTRCAQQVQAFTADTRSFLEEKSYANFRVVHEARKAEQKRRPFFLRLRFVMPTLALAAAGAAAALVVSVTAPTPDAPSFRLKGAGVGLTFQHADGSVGMSGETVAAGTQLQLAYDAGENTHMALLGIDGAGKVSVYFPENVDHLVPVPSGSHGPLPFSLTLDATPGPERFVAVYARGPQKLDRVVEAAEAIAKTDLRHAPPLDLPIDLSQSSFLVVKP